MANREGPGGPSGVGPATWQDPPHNRWAFWHVDELLPTLRVPGADRPREFDVVSEPMDVGSVELMRFDGRRAQVSSVLADTHTDACVVLQDGAVVFEEYGGLGGRECPHALMSVTKPMVGCVAAVLMERGDLDPRKLVTDYVPELEASGYRGARVRDVLDMRSGVRFREEYTDPVSDICERDRWIGRSRGNAHRSEGLYSYLSTLDADGPHGGPFRYRSAETDVIGWVCERAAARQMADLLATSLWQPMGAGHDARLICDGSGTAIHGGGLCATARDVARFGQLLLDGGAVPDGEGGQRVVVPPRWLRQAWAVDSDVRAAFATSPAELMFPGGWFRNQFWFRPGPHGDVLVCLGIYGQMIHVSRRTRTVCVKLSSWPDPQSTAHLQDAVRAFDAVAGALRSRAPSDAWQRQPGLGSGLTHTRGPSHPHHSGVI